MGFLGSFVLVFASYFPFLITDQAWQQYRHEYIFSSSRLTRHWKCPSGNVGISCISFFCSFCLKCIKTIEYKGLSSCVDKNSFKLMFGLMPTSRTWLDSSFHNIANRADWLCMFCVCARVNRSYCCLSVCKIHCWTVNELIMSEYIHGMFTSCIDFTITLICTLISFYMSCLAVVKKGCCVLLRNHGW